MLRVNAHVGDRGDDIEQVIQKGLGTRRPLSLLVEVDERRKTGAEVDDGPKDDEIKEDVDDDGDDSEGMRLVDESFRRMENAKAQDEFGFWEIADSDEFEDKEPPGMRSKKTKRKR